MSSELPNQPDEPAADWTPQGHLLRRRPGPSREQQDPVRLDATRSYSLFTALAIYVAAVVASLVVLAGLWQLFLLIFGD